MRVKVSLVHDKGFSPYAAFADDWQLFKYLREASDQDPLFLLKSTITDMDVDLPDPKKPVEG